MTAVARAGAGKAGAARTHRPRKGSLRAWIERQLVAAAFAEEGLHEEARRISGDERASRSGDPLDVLLGAHGVRMFCGSLSPAALAVRR